MTKLKTKYELEKVRRYFYLGTKPDVFTVIKESNNLEELEALAKDIKLRVGKTFHETLVINEWTDDHADIYQVIFLKDSEDDWDYKTDKRKVRKK